MLQNRATLREIRSFVLNECRRVYSPDEAISIGTLIMEHCEIQGIRTISEPEHQPGSSTVTQIKEIVTEIHSLRPIQYILGESHFYGLRIKVDERVLIPRPETEEMVHRIVQERSTVLSEVLDLGCGSGCIALALKKAFPGCLARGMDLEKGALELAQENASINNLEVEWLEGDILGEALPAARAQGYDLVVSNPPYVKESEKAQMKENVLDFEPAKALFVSDADPLVHYRAIAEKTRTLMASGGILWLEINEAYGDKIKALLEDFGYKNVQILKDIHGKERFARGSA